MPCISMSGVRNFQHGGERSAAACLIGDGAEDEEGNGFTETTTISVWPAGLIKALRFAAGRCFKANGTSESPTT